MLALILVAAIAYTANIVQQYREFQLREFEARRDRVIMQIESLSTRLHELAQLAERDALVAAPPKDTPYTAVSQNENQPSSTTALLLSAVQDTAIRPLSALANDGSTVSGFVYSNDHTNLTAIPPLNQSDQRRLRRLGALRFTEEYAATVDAVLARYSLSELKTRRPLWIPVAPSDRQHSSMSRMVLPVFRGDRLAETLVISVPVDRFLPYCPSHAQTPVFLVLDCTCERRLDEEINGPPAWVTHAIRENAPHIQASSNEVKIVRTGLTFMITERIPGPGWVAISVFSLKDLILQYKNKLFVILLSSSVAALILALITVLFDRRTRRNTRARLPSLNAPNDLAQSMINSLPIGMGIFSPVSQSAVMQNSIASEILGPPEVPDQARRFYQTVLAERERIGGQDDAGRAFFHIEWVLADGKKTHLGVAVSDLQLGGCHTVLVGLINVGASSNGTLTIDTPSQPIGRIDASTLSLAILGHEIRTPLHGATGNLELLARAGLTQEQRERVAIIQRSFDNMLTLVNDMLDTAKWKAQGLELNQTPIRINELVEQSAQIFSPAICERGIEFFCMTDPRIDRLVEGDGQRLTQVLQNLLNNAAKFTESGFISIESQQLGVEKERIWVRVLVQDTGIGISLDVQSQLFQPLAQADESIATRFGGTGLGLYVCRQLVAKMDGKISLVSAPGTGSTFIVDIPFQLAEHALDDDPGRPLVGLHVDVMCDAPAQRKLLLARLLKWGAIEYLPSRTDLEPAIRICVSPYRAESSNTPHRAPMLGTLHLSATGPLVPTVDPDGNLRLTSLSTRSLWTACMNLLGTASPLPKLVPAEEFDSAPMNVLVVDDDEVSLALIEEQLRLLGCHMVGTAATGSDAIQQWRMQRPDVLITDLNLPDMEGQTLLAAIRNEDPHLQAIAATAAASDDINPIDDNLCSVLQKPISLAALRAALARVTVHAKPRHITSENPKSLDVRSNTRTVVLRQAFCQAWEKDRQSLTNAVDVADWFRLRRRLHRLHGALLAVGQEDLAQQSLALQMICQHPEDANRLAIQCRAFFERVEQYAMQT